MSTSEKQGDQEEQSATSPVAEADLATARGDICRGPSPLDRTCPRARTIGQVGAQQVRLKVGGLAMQAAVGDKIVVRGHRAGETDREAIILAVDGSDGAPPYRVRWSDDGHEGMFFPGSDAVVEHYPAEEA